MTRFGEFEGNIKYLFLYLQQLQDRSWDCIFLTQKKHVYKDLKEAGLPVWLYPRLLTLLRLFWVSVIIVDGNEWARYLKYFFLYSSKKVQLWHGTGLKTVGLLKPNILHLHPLHRRLKKESIFYDLLFLTSPFQVEKREQAFRYGKLCLNGYPRNDILFPEGPLQLSRSQLGCEHDTIVSCQAAIKEGLSIVTYAPTWRRAKTHLSQLNIQQINDFARENQCLFIIKLHYKQESSLHINDYSHIIEYRRDGDIYPLLSLSHILITDYSSIYLDYLLLHRPIIFFPYDKERYISRERKLLLDYDMVTPGSQCFTQEELLDALYQHMVLGQDPYKKKREKLRDLFFTFQDGGSSERAWQAIKRYIIKDPESG